MNPKFQIFAKLFLFLITIFSIQAGITLSPKAQQHLDRQTVENDYRTLLARLNIAENEVGDIAVHISDENPTIQRIFDESSPDWGVGLAIPSRRMVIIEPDVGSPYRVVQHELCHIVVDRVSREPLPVWFDEGVAEYFSRPWQRNDELKIAYQIVVGLPRLVDMEGLYLKTGYRAGNLYALSYIAVKYLVSQFGEDALGDIIRRTRLANSFDDGFVLATGETTVAFDVSFHRFVITRFGVLQLVFNDWVLWFVIVALMFAAMITAYIRKRRRLKEEERDKVIEFEEPPYPPI